MKRVLHKIAHHYRDIPNKKPYLEFITAILSIPVLLTVIILNLSTLRGNKDNKAPSPTTERIYVTIPEAAKATPDPSIGPCTPGIGSVSISSPEENEIVTDNPVQITINYKKGSFCEVVWSYRVNNGKWSDYDDRSIALYNLPQGNIKLDLRIKSIVNSDTDSISRNFIYQGSSVVPTTPISSTSAN
jgi:hypothetical protein